MLAMLDAMLQAAGRRVQRYISPHLVRFNERFLFDGQPIGEPELADVLDVCERVNAGQPITEFEITTAAAFLAFARHPADVLLIETGLGGRLDATNVIARPRLTAIAPISLDHQDYLGERLEQIAFEKAGILKPGVACVVGPQPPEALAVIEARAAEVGAPLIAPRPRLAGVAGGRPAAGARSARARSTCRCRCCPAAIRSTMPASPWPRRWRSATSSPAPDAIAAGLRQARWPARLQLLRRGPLVELLPAGWQLWLDGGHNPAAAQALAASLSGPDADPRPLHLIVGMLTTKDERGFLAPLAPLARSITTVPVPDEPASRDPVEAARLAAGLGWRATPARDSRARCARSSRPGARPRGC